MSALVGGSNGDIRTWGFRGAGISVVPPGFLCLLRGHGPLFLGPRINPEAGLPAWLGTVLGLIIVAGVIYLKYGQEYRVTPIGLVKTSRWPSARQQVIPWERLGEVSVSRGMVQSMLQVGNLVITDAAGGPQMFWYGLAKPQEIKDLIDKRRP